MTSKAEAESQRSTVVPETVLPAMAGRAAVRDEGAPETTATDSLARQIVAGTPAKWDRLRRSFGSTELAELEMVTGMSYEANSQDRVTKVAALAASSVECSRVYGRKMDSATLCSQTEASMDGETQACGDSMEASLGDAVRTSMN